MYDSLYEAAEHIRSALVDLLDRLDADDIQYFTGLSPERSNEIYQLYLQVENLK